MRHRKVLNLYDTDPGHEQLLIYLEGIEGPTRQSQALVQMAMVGYRVMALHESGEEAYLRVRNPDISALTKPTRRQATRALEYRREEPAGAVISPAAHHPSHPSDRGSAPRPITHEKRSPAPVEKHERKPITSTVTPSKDVVDDLERVAHEDLNDEFNTLKILQRMGEAD